MAKGAFWDDTFEQLAELGKSTVKHTVKSVKQTFDPLKMAENAFGKGEKSAPEQAAEKMKGKNNTPLDFAKLNEKYQNQDQAKTDALRQKLFQMVKQGDERVLSDQKQGVERSKQQAEYAEADKKRRAQEAMRQPAPEPQGKERKSILAPRKKKATLPDPAEMKVSAGK